MKADFALFAKGVAMGAANVIPGVSGGTIALITGIYERLINALKNGDITALKQLLSGDIKGFWNRIDGRWLSILLAGVAISIVTLAKLFEYLLEHHEKLTMAFFFGLILVSIWFVAKRINHWNATAFIALFIGALVAVLIATLAPASENASFAYVFLCGVIAISSMILPGLSGSFILIIMGNYALVLGAISTFSMSIILPMALGCVVGLVVFSQILAWVFKHYHDQTLALMTGFVVGSLVIIWPWKNATLATVAREGKPPKEVIVSYDWLLPSLGDSNTWIALALMIAGGISIALMEKFGSAASSSTSTAQGQ